MDWRTYADEAQIDVEQLKAELPLDWVVSQKAGILLEENGERASGICPFHPDEDPSFDIYSDGARWGCFPCGLDGDLFDFIGKYWGLDTFPAQLEQAQLMLAEFAGEADTWERVALESEPPADPELLAAEARSAYKLYLGGTRYPLAQLLEAKDLDIDPDWLHRKWYVGVDSDLNVVAPYVALDGGFTSYKTRYSGTSGWYARKGGKLTSLYGEHQLKEVDVDAPIWICEGETDTWLASWLLADRGVAVGLPTGAGSTIRPEWVELFRGRTVTLVFDADRAGRDAARAWHQALRGIATEVRISWPDAGDLCESTHPVGVLYGGETVQPIPRLLAATPDGAGYAVLTKDGDAGSPLSNWMVRPHKRIHNTDINGETLSQGLEVSFLNEPSKRVRVPDDVWDGGRAMLRWVKQNNRGWFGTGSKYSQAVFTTLVAETPFLGTERGVEVIGLHGVEEGAPVFVLQDEVIGSAIAAERWRYTAPTTGDANFSRYKLGGAVLGAGDAETFRAWGRDVAFTLMRANQAYAMTPMIAWMCASIGRSLVREFPPLGVFGGADSGKTTILREVFSTLLGMNEEHNLTSTTPHGVRVWLAGTNALAIWLDEFRRGAADNTMNFVRQSLRDAWTASSSSRGGYGTDKQKVHESKVAAPLVVSGEENLEERSHIDRVVSVVLNKRDRDPEALRALQEARGKDGIGRLGRAYIEWFVHELSEDRITPPAGKYDRREQGESMLEWGWSMWRRFCLEVLELPSDDILSLDLSSVRGERAAAAEHPLVDALHEAISLGATEPGAQDGIPVAWVMEPAGEDGVSKSVVAVRVRAFQLWATRAGYQLPGGERSTRSWLAQRYTVDKRQRAQYGLGGGMRALLLIGVLEDDE